MWEDMQRSVGQNGCYLHSWKKIARLSSFKDFEWFWNFDGMICNNCFFSKRLSCSILCLRSTLISFSTPCRFCSSTFARNGVFLDSHIFRLCWLSVGWGGGATKSKTENDRAWAPFVLRQDQISISLLTEFGILLPGSDSGWRYFHPSWTLGGVASFYRLVNCQEQYQVNSLPLFYERVVMRWVLLSRSMKCLQFTFFIRKWNEKTVFLIPYFLHVSGKFSQRRLIW